MSNVLSAVVLLYAGLMSVGVDAPEAEGAIVSAVAESSDVADDGEVMTEAYVCEDGTTFEARFDNSWTYSIAVLMLKDQAEIPLIQAPSGSGVIYSNGDYTLHTKADSAVLMRNDKTWLCKAK